MIQLTSFTSLSFRTFCRHQSHTHIHAASCTQFNSMSHSWGPPLSGPSVVSKTRALKLSAHQSCDQASTHPWNPANINMKGHLWSLDQWQTNLAPHSESDSPPSHSTTLTGSHGPLRSTTDFLSFQFLVCHNVHRLVIIHYTHGCTSSNTKVNLW